MPCLLRFSAGIFGGFVVLPHYIEGLLLNFVGIHSYFSRVLMAAHPNITRGLTGLNINPFFELVKGISRVSNHPALNILNMSWTEENEDTEDRCSKLYMESSYELRPIEHKKRSQ